MEEHVHTWLEIDNYGDPTGYFYCQDIDCCYSIIESPWQLEGDLRALGVSEAEIDAARVKT